jgi:CCR4-NOT transcription complex subunit 1
VTASREVIAKDFATEVDEGKLRRSSNIMVKALAGPLAQTTSRDPIKITMISQLRSMLLQNGYQEDHLPEAEVHQVVNDNLDMACGIVEKLASDRAFGMMNEQIEPAVLTRKKHRAGRPGQPFIDPEFGSRFALSQALPEPLRLKQGGLTQAQMKVYDDFALIPKTTAAATAIYGVQLPGSLLTAERGDRAAAISDIRPDGPFAPAVSQEPSVPVRQNQPPPPLGPPPFPDSLREKIYTALSQLEAEIRKGEYPTYSAVPSDHFIRVTIKTLVEDLAKVPQREEASILCASKVVLMLYSNSNSIFARDTFVILLTRLCEISTRLMKDLSNWLLYGEDEVHPFDAPLM